jgi:SAM-dependent methyltransferase
MSGLESHYSAYDIENRILEGLRNAGLDPDARLTVEELAALDHFHTGGLRASRELSAEAKIQPDHTVLDIGAGLAGSARMLVADTGCRVDCIEMSQDYCLGARLLNRLTCMEERIGIFEGSALELPFQDGAYDLVWMQNVGMNIADKQTLYAEIARVLKPGGRFAFQEMIAGDGPTTHFPLPWASEPADNNLISYDEMGGLIEGAGFVAELFEDTSDVHLSRSATANATPAAQGQLGLSVFVDNLGEKSTNARLSLEDGKVRLVRGVFRKKE